MCVIRYNREAIERNLAEARQNVRSCPMAHIDMWAERVDKLRAELAALNAFEGAVRRLIATTSDVEIAAIRKGEVK